MRFRERGKDKPTIEVAGRPELVAYLRELLLPWPTAPDPVGIRTHADPIPTDWGPTFVVILPGYGVIGYTDAPV
jgi:hypothetical protein